MLLLKVKCEGSPPFHYCIDYQVGPYNVTGNETCRNTLTTLTCDINIVRYYFTMDVHTVVLIINNNLAKIVTPISINIYKGV